VRMVGVSPARSVEKIFDIYDFATSSKVVFWLLA